MSTPCEDIRCGARQHRARFEGFLEGRRWGIQVGIVLGVTASLALATIAKMVAVWKAVLP